MGHNITQRGAQFRIDRERCAPALDALRALIAQAPEKGSGYRWKGDEPKVHHFAYVSTEQAATTKTLPEMLLAWRYSADVDDYGNIICLWFRGQPLGDDALLFQALAPFVDAGSYLTFEGEDGACWRWVFDGQCAFERQGKLVFE